MLGGVGYEGGLGGVGWAVVGGAGWVVVGGVSSGMGGRGGRGTVTGECRG